MNMYLIKDKRAALKFSFLILGLITIVAIIIYAGGVFANGLTEVWVDDDYHDQTSCGTHTWDVDCFDTIQEGIDAVSGSTVYVGPGTYAESVLIDTSLTLVGVSGKPVITGASQNYIIKVTANDVVIDNFEVNGGGSGTGDNAFDYGIWVYNSDYVEVKNSFIKNIWKVSSSGIQVDDSSYSDIHHNVISSFHKRGIRYINSDGLFYDNEVIGDHIDGTSRVQNLVNLWGGSSVDIYNNNLHDALSTESSPTWDSPAIFVSSYGGSGDSHAEIYNNDIYDCDSGIVIGSVYATTDGSSADITNNRLYNLGWGINFEVDRIIGGQNTVSAIITENSFTDNVLAVRAINTITTIDAEDNYWGHYTGADAPGQNTGYGDSVSGNVDVCPFWDSYPNGVSTSCYIDTNGPVVSEIEIDPLYNNGRFNVSAIVSDLYLWSPIQTAEYFVGHGSSGSCGTQGTGTTTYPEDDVSFDDDNVVEDVFAEDVELFEDGLNWICMQAQDIQDNWGNCVCAYFESDTFPPELVYNIKLNDILVPNIDEVLVCDNDPTLYATICDSQSDIQGGEFFLNLLIPPGAIPAPWSGLWLSVLNNYLDGGWHCSDLSAVIDLDLLEDGTHYINQIRGKDIVENWGKLYDQNYGYSFIKDTMAPVTEKQLNPNGISVSCSKTTANENILTDGCAYVKQGTTIDLSAIDPDPQQTDEFAGDVVIHYNVYWSEDCETNWILDQNGQSQIDDPVTITLDKDSCHLIEYWAEDSCGWTEDKHYELDIVDTQAPETTKTIDGIYTEGEGNPIDHYLGSQSAIILNCTDPQPHPVDDVTLYWKTYWSEDCDTLEWDCLGGDSSNGYAEITYEQSSCHKLEYWCVDALGNTEEKHIEIDAVDLQPPIIEKEIIGPNLECEAGGVEDGEELCNEWDCVAGEKDFMIKGRHGGAGGWRSAIIDIDVHEFDPVAKDFNNPWEDGVERGFSVSYDSTTGKVTYNYGGNSLEYYYNSGKAFEYVSIMGRGDGTAGSNGAKTELTNLKLNGVLLTNNVITAEGSKNGVKVYLSDASQATGWTISGTAKLTYGSSPADEIPAFYVTAMNTHDPEPEDCYYIDGVTEIHVNAEDLGPHPSNNVMCNWWYIWNSQEYEGGINVTPPFIISGWNESRHDLYIECWDALGNAARDVELFIVDKTPPTTTKEYIGPQYPEQDYPKWISTDTEITLIAQDLCPHPSGVNKTYWRNTIVLDENCWSQEVCQQAIGDGPWNEYEGPFHKERESCHLIEYYSVDNVEKSEIVKKQCVFVDDTPPVGDKEVGEPKYLCEEGEDKCGPAGDWPAWYVNSSTPITLSCNDPEPHPVDHSELCFAVSWHVDRETCNQYEGYWDEGEGFCYITREYTQEGGDWNDGYYCVDLDENEEFVFNFKEDSLHNLEWFCEDALGNQGEEQIEWDNVDNQPPQIIVHNPTPDETDIERCIQGIVIEAWDEKSGVDESSVYAELIDDGGEGDVVETVELTKSIYGTFEGLMEKEHPVGEYLLRICASDNLGNQYCKEIEEYLEETVIVEFIHPSECNVDPEQGGECEFSFNLCMRGDNGLKFWLDKLGGVVTPAMMNATTVDPDDVDDDAFVGLRHEQPYNNENDCENAGYVWEEGACWYISDAEFLQLGPDCIDINGKEQFDLDLNITSQVAQSIGPGIHDLNYWIETFLEPDCP